MPQLSVSLLLTNTLVSSPRRRMTQALAQGVPVKCYSYSLNDGYLQATEWRCGGLGWGGGGGGGGEGEGLPEATFHTRTSIW